MAKLVLRSNRPCPSCGGEMFYVKTLTTPLTRKYRRVCQACKYKDPNRVILYPLDPVGGAS